MTNSPFLIASESDDSKINHLSFTDSAEDELQYCFALANSVIDQRTQALAAALQSNDHDVQADDHDARASIRLRLLQEMLIEQLPSLRGQNVGAK